MDKLEILNMEAGNKLNASVAELIMGIKVEYPFGEGYPYYLKGNPEIPKEHFKYDTIPKYSMDIVAAFQVSNKLKEDDLTLELIDGADGNVMATFISISGDHIFRYESAVCMTVPEAICKAALFREVIA